MAKISGLLTRMASMRPIGAVRSRFSSTSQRPSSRIKSRTRRPAVSCGRSTRKTEKRAWPRACSIRSDQRVNRIEWAGLPGGDLVQDGIRDGADQIGRDLDAIQLAQVPDDLAGAHAPRVHRDHLVVQAGEAALILGNQLGIEAGLAIARDL